MPVLAPDRGKPAFYMTTPALVSADHRSLWDRFSMHLPLSDGDVVDAGPLTVVSPAPDQWDVVWVNTGTIDYVVTPFGPGYFWNSPGSGDRINLGSRISEPNLMRGDNAHTVAMVFSWDGTTGDQRTLLSSGGGLGELRLRLENASPANIFQREQSLSVEVTADTWYLLVYRPFGDLGDISDIDLMLVDLEDLSVQHDRVTTSSANVLTQYDGTEDIGLMGIGGNDPAEGITLAGFWKWDRRLGGDDAELDIAHWGELGEFIRDPWGMFRLDPIHFLDQVALQKLYPNSEIQVGGWATTPGSLELWETISDDPDDDARYISWS